MKKWLWRIFWTAQVIGFFYGYWTGIKLIHNAYGG